MRAKHELQNKNADVLEMQRFGKMLMTCFVQCVQCKMIKMKQHLTCVFLLVGTKERCLMFKKTFLLTQNHSEQQPRRLSQQAVLKRDVQQQRTTIWHVFSGFGSLHAQVAQEMLLSNARENTCFRKQNCRVLVHERKPDWLHCRSI